MVSKRATPRESTVQDWPGFLFSRKETLTGELRTRPGDTPHLVQPSPPRSRGRRWAPLCPLHALVSQPTPPRARSRHSGRGSEAVSPFRKRRPPGLRGSATSSGSAADTRLSAFRACAALPTLGEPRFREPGLNRAQQRYAPTQCACIARTRFPPVGVFSAVYPSDRTYVENRVWCRCDAGRLKAWITLMFSTINP